MRAALRTALVVLFAAAPLSAFPAPGPGGLVAIDVLLQPGPHMLAEAERWNARLRRQSPEGFRLDGEHVPHITLVQRFVQTSDLPQVLAAIEAATAGFDVSRLEMTATGLYQIPWGDIALAGILVEPTPQLRELQQAVIRAVDAYARKGGDESAFVPDRSGTPFEPMLIDYVDTFVPSQAGENFRPHVTVGIAPPGWLRALEQEPFAKFTFGATGIATYQLGNFGTASRRLDSGR